MQSLYEEHAGLVARGIDGTIEAGNCDKGLTGKFTRHDFLLCFLRFLNLWTGFLSDLFYRAHKVAIALFQYILEQVRYDVDKVHGGFFGVGEPRNRPAFRNGRSMRRLHVREDSGCAANERRSFPAESASSMSERALRSAWPPRGRARSSASAQRV